MTAMMSDKVRKSLERVMEFPVRPGRPEEFAMLVRQGVENCMLNGVVLRLDGGMRMPSKLWRWGRGGREVLGERGEGRFGGGLYEIRDWEEVGSGKWEVRSDKSASQILENIFVLLASTCFLHEETLLTIWISCLA
jgi:hypothetical protein